MEPGVVASREGEGGAGCTAALLLEALAMEPAVLGLLPPDALSWDGLLVPGSARGCTRSGPSCSPCAASSREGVDKDFRRASEVDPTCTGETGAVDQRPGRWRNMLLFI